MISVEQHNCVNRELSGLERRVLDSKPKVPLCTVAFSAKGSLNHLYRRQFFILLNLPCGPCDGQMTKSR